MSNEFVYTASGERCEGTFGSYDEAKNTLIKSGAWGVVLKHKPYKFKDGLEIEEETVFEYLREERNG